MEPTPLWLTILLMIASATTGYIFSLSLEKHKRNYNALLPVKKQLMTALLYDGSYFLDLLPKQKAILEARVSLSKLKRDRMDPYFIQYISALEKTIKYDDKLQPTYNMENLRIMERESEQLLYACD